MTPALIVILCLVAIACIVIGGILIQYRLYSGAYKTLARTLCDPGSWSVSFYVRTLLLKGRVDGHTVRYAVFGDHRKDQEVSSYLLLESPVRRNFRFYAASDAAMADPEIAGKLEELQADREFCALTVTSAETPLLAKFLARPFGFGHRPGVLLWKWGKRPFGADALRRDVKKLIELSEGM